MSAPVWIEPAATTVPVLLTLKSVVVALAVDEPIAKSVVWVEPLLACMASCAKGEVVPRPALEAVNDPSVTPSLCKNLKPVELLLSSNGPLAAT